MPSGMKSLLDRRPQVFRAQTVPRRQDKPMRGSHRTIQGGSEAARWWRRFTATVSGFLSRGRPAPGDEHEVHDAFVPLTSRLQPTLSVAAIVDEFTEQCLRPEWRLALLSRDHWREEIEQTRPAFVFVESAWRGNGGAWRNALTKFARANEHPLWQLLLYCRSVGLPTVFWGKEDPPNFAAFRDAAAEFDHIFTTDAGSVPRYVAACGHRRVYVLPFAAQPILHNPAQRRESPQVKVAFAGGWYAHKHVARRNYLRRLLDGALAAGCPLTIYDRFSDRSGRDRAKHRFPRRYRPYIRPKLEYQAMLTAYRRYPVFLNVNSVTDSPTMFSRRVFELLACGTAVVSSPAVGLSTLLPDLVTVAEDAHAVARAIADIRSDPESQRRRAHLGYRAIMRGHTYGHRTAEVVARVRPDLAAQGVPPLVSVVGVVQTAEEAARILVGYRRQRHVAKELILGIQGGIDPSVSRAFVLSGERLVELPAGLSRGACLDRCLELAGGRFVALVDEQAEYGGEYLGDAILPFAFVDAPIVGKRTHYAWRAAERRLMVCQAGHEHRECRDVIWGTLVVERDLLRHLPFDVASRNDAPATWIARAATCGFRMYAADRYNFVRIESDAAVNARERIANYALPTSDHHILGNAFLDDIVARSPES